MTRALERLLREPLTGFLLLGALLFALDARTGGAPAGGAIEVPPARVAAARERLQGQLGREPSDAELRAQLDGWIEQELLYRAALDLGLAEGDPIIRRRLAQKMGLLLEQRATSREPTDAELLELLAEQPARYAEPARYRFEHAYYPREQHGAAAARVAAEALARARAQPDAPPPSGTPFFGGQSFDSLSAPQLRKIFGQGFAEALATLAPGDWQGPVESGYGAHLVRLIERVPAQPATLAEIRPELVSEWREQVQRQARRDALAELRERYPLRLPDSP